MMKVQLQKTLDFSTEKTQLNISFDAKMGEVIALYGASGAGKTSTLRMIAGLTKPDSGTIDFKGSMWFDHKAHINLKPQKRPLGFTFQDGALFSNMSVRENLEYAKRPDFKTNDIDRLLQQAKLEGLQHKKPNALSGGQKQRVALVRALVAQTQLLLLDEPLSSQDPELKNNLQDLILEHHQEHQGITIMTSHDITEIYKMANKVIVLKSGKMIKIGTPQEVFLSDAQNKTPVILGKILDIEIVGNQAKVTVLIGHQPEIIYLETSKVENLKPGHLIELKYNLLENSIQKKG